MTTDNHIATVCIDLDGNFETSDGRIGHIATTPELAELNAFLGVLSGSFIPANAFDKVLRKITRRFSKVKGSILEIRSSKEGHELVHRFQIANTSPLSYEETDKLLSENSWSLDCWSPLEISNSAGDTATGEAAQIVIESLRS